MISIDNISTTIKNAFSSFRNPATVLPAILMICSLAKRPGLSTLLSAANVITNQSKFGAPTGKLPDGTENMMNGLIAVIIDEVFRAIREDANIQIALAPGDITIQATGANAGGPVTVVGTNINPVHGVGVLQ